DGFDGFTRYEVGVLVNNAAEGSIAEGVLTGSGAIGASRPSTVLVGYMNSAQGNGTANGSMSTAGALDVTGALEVGQIFQSGSGSKASGALQADSLSGEVSQWLIVGNVTGGSDDLTVGN